MFLVAWDVHYWRAEISPIVLALEQQGLAVYLKPVLTEVCQWLKIGTRIFTISALRETGLESSNLMRHWLHKMQLVDRWFCCHLICSNKWEKDNTIHQFNRKSLLGSNLYNWFVLCLLSMTIYTLFWIWWRFVSFY